MSRKPTVGRAVDWGFAATVGAKLTRQEPATTDYTRNQVRAQLADSARRAELPVREVTLLNEGAEVPDPAQAASAAATRSRRPRR